MLPLRNIYTILCIIGLCFFTRTLVSVVTAKNLYVCPLYPGQSFADQTVLFADANIRIGLKAARHAV